MDLLEGFFLGGGIFWVKSEAINKVVLYLGKFFFIFWSITLYLGFKLLRISR
jgi:hypothetical protein